MLPKLLLLTVTITIIAKHWFDGDYAVSLPQSGPDLIGFPWRYRTHNSSIVVAKDQAVENTANSRKGK